MNRVEQVLRSAYPDELVDRLLEAFEEIETNFARGKWKASELDAGHFVEIARRIVELETLNSYTPIGDKLPRFHTGILGKFEQGSGDESFRILIPRVLWSTFAVRNKRGVAHVGTVSPNEADASVIRANARWVMAEIVRLKSNLSADETASLVHDLVKKEAPLVWSVGDRDRVLDPNMKARDQVLVLLFAESPRGERELKSSIGYANITNFRDILQRLHDKRLINYSEDGQCHISPTGETEAERIIHESQSVLR